MIYYCQNYRIMEYVARQNYYLNPTFRIDIKDFTSLTRILIQTQLQSGPK